jgi:hypothetical protein
MLQDANRSSLRAFLSSAESSLRRRLPVSHTVWFKLRGGVGQEAFTPPSFFPSRPFGRAGKAAKQVNV